MNELYFEELLQSYDEEHADAVMVAKENFNSWIELIIWDLLEVQSSFKKLTEATASEKYQHRLDTLKEDIKILDDQTSGESLKIFDVSGSNQKLIKLVGFINNTMSILDDQQRQTLTILVNTMKESIHNFVSTNHKGLKDLIWAEKSWNKLSLKKKNRILYDLEELEECVENESNYIYLKA
jgi:hypothetical protein